MKAVRVSTNMTTLPSALLAVYDVLLLSMITDVCHKQEFGGWGYQGLHCWVAKEVLT